MFKAESSTPKKVLYCIFLFTLAKCARIFYDTNITDTVFENLKNPLLDVFTAGATNSLDYCELRYYCLAGLSEMMLANEMLSIGEVIVSLIYNLD